MATLKFLSLSALSSPALGAIWFTAPTTVPAGSAPVLQPAFVSYSIEFAFLPDYAGEIRATLRNMRKHIHPT
jgi:hypothetical protein